MAAPTPASSRPTPSGIKLDDGFSTEVVFSAYPNIGFWEKTVQPPGLDGMPAVDTTTMHNTTYRTFSPRHLKTMTPFTMKVAYDPLLYTSIVPMINNRDTVTVFFPDNSKLAFYGFLQDFKPDAVEEGKQPEATITVTPTNQDSSGVEQAPVLVNVAGT